MSKQKGSTATMDFVSDYQVMCPYCGEVFSMSIDTSQSSYETIEDCTVCCRPIQFTVTCEPGEVLDVAADRA